MRGRRAGTRAAAWAVIGLWLACGHPTDPATAPAAEPYRPTSDRACWIWCEWPDETPDCFLEDAARRYEVRAASATVERLRAIEPLEPDDCVCVRFRYTRDGDAADLGVRRSTREEAAEIALEAIRSSSPYGPVPEEAACLLDEWIYRSFHGRGAAADPAAERARDCHETADRMAERGLEDYARRIRANCPEL